MVEDVLEIAEKYPKQKIMFLNGDIPATGVENPPNVYSARFKNEELGYLGGYFAALITNSDLPNANEDLKVGLIFTDISPHGVLTLSLDMRMESRLLIQRLR